MFLNNPTFEEAFAMVVLGKYPPNIMMDLSDKWLTDGHYSDHFVNIIFEMMPSIYEVGPAFEAALIELGSKKPSNIEAAICLCEATINKIKKREIDSVYGAEFIYTELYNEVLHDIGDEKYVGDCINMQYVFSWLREYWDCNDGSTIFYYNNLPRDEAALKFKEHIYEESLKWERKELKCKWPRGTE